LGTGKVQFLDGSSIQYNQYLSLLKKVGI
jgi:hypothetical protein